MSHTVGTSTTYTPSRYYEAAGSSSKKHVYVGDLLVATVDNNGATTTTYTIHTDHLGGTSVVSDPTGAAVQVLDYYPYGALRSDTHSAFNERRKFIGQEYDDDSQLSYLNARYYAGTRGQFISQDPMFWLLPREWLLDPQQQNSYSYGRDNPINRSDPTGLYTIAVPGTFNDSEQPDPKVWSDTGKASQFLSNVSKTFVEKAEIFRWSGENNDKARKDAATRLAQQINDHPFKDGEKLNIVGHSHAGNIAMLASRKLDRKIDTLVTLGTPNRTVYQPLGKITNHINAYSAFDRVQKIGEIVDPLVVSGNLREQLKLTRFCGHPSICVRGVYNVEDETILYARVPPPDGRVGTCGPLARGTGT